MVKDGQIYIRGYPRDTKEDSLREAFTEFGDIIEVKMVTPAYSFIVHHHIQLRHIRLLSRHSWLSKRWTGSSSKTALSLWKLQGLKRP